MTVAAEASQQQQLQLEQSLRGLLQFQTNEKSFGGAPSEQITELTQSVNKFLESMESGQKDKSDKDSWNNNNNNNNNNMVHAIDGYCTRYPNYKLHGCSPL